MTCSRFLADRISSGASPTTPALLLSAGGAVCVNCELTDGEDQVVAACAIARKHPGATWHTALHSYSDTASKLPKNIYRHHAKPKRASATAPLCTEVDMCKTGVGAGSSAGADKEPNRRQSNHEWTDDQAGRRRLAQHLFLYQATC